MTGVGALDASLSPSAALAPALVRAQLQSADGDFTLTVCAGSGFQACPFTLPQDLVQFLKRSDQSKTLNAILDAAGNGLFDSRTGRPVALLLALEAQKKMKTDPAEHPDPDTAAKTRAGTGGVVTGEELPKNDAKLDGAGGAPAGEAMANNGGGAPKVGAVPAGAPPLEDDPPALEREWEKLPADIRERAMSEIDRRARAAQIFTEVEISKLKNDPKMRAQIIRHYKSGELLKLSPLAEQQFQAAIDAARTAKLVDPDKPLWQYPEFWFYLTVSLALLVVLVALARGDGAPPETPEA